MLGPALLPILVFLFVAFVLIKIIRGIAGTLSNSGGAGPASNLAVGVQLAEDGFWLTSCPANPMAVIHYYYWTGGVRRAGQIPFQPDNQGKQFVYTGGRPEQVSIVRIVEQGDDLSPSILPPIIASESTLWDTPANPPSAPSSSSGFPSAY